MTESSKQSFQKYAKILAFLRKRKQSQHPSLSKSGWPTQSSFTLLNNIQPIIQSPPENTPNAKPARNHSARTLKSTTLATTTPILRIQRPTTSAGRSQMGRKTAEPNHRKPLQRSLFDCFKEEKLVRLKSQKEALMNTIFRSDKIEIHRIDEGEQISTKANAINFKTYQSLNKLMDLQEKINETSNLRPKTSCSYLKKRAQLR